MAHCFVSLFWWAGKFFLYPLEDDEKNWNDEHTQQHSCKHPAQCTCANGAVT